MLFLKIHFFTTDHCADSKARKAFILGDTGTQNAEVQRSCIRLKTNYSGGGAAAASSGTASAGTSSAGTASSPGAASVSGAGASAGGDTLGKRGAGSRQRGGQLY